MLATAATTSFAGQHESFLNVSGPDDAFESCRRCFASIFTDRAISHRIGNGFDHFKAFLSVGVMSSILKATGRLRGADGSSRTARPRANSPLAAAQR